MTAKCRSLKPIPFTQANAGTNGSDAWTFTDTTANYSNASGTVADGVSDRNATVNYIGWPMPSNITGMQDGHRRTQKSQRGLRPQPNQKL